MNNEISIFRFIVWKLFSLIFKEENLAVLLGRGSHVKKKKKKKTLSYSASQSLRLRIVAFKNFGLS